MRALRCAGLRLTAGGASLGALRGGGGMGRVAGAGSQRLDHAAMDLLFMQVISPLPHVACMQGRELLAKDGLEGDSTTPP